MITFVPPGRVSAVGSETGTQGKEKRTRKEVGMSQSRGKASAAAAAAAAAATRRVVDAKKISAFETSIRSLIARHSASTDTDSDSGSETATATQQELATQDLLKIYKGLLRDRKPINAAFTTRRVNSIYDEAEYDDDAENFESDPRERFKDDEYRRKREETLSKVDHELIKEQSRRLGATTGVNKTGTFRSYYSKNYIGMAPVYW